MIVRTVSEFGEPACDTFGRITANQAKSLRATGFRGIFLYPEVIEREDLEAAFDADMWVGFVLEGLAASTVPTADMGKRIASAAGGKLRAIGVPPGVTVFGDLEGDGHPPEAWIEFANAQADATRALGDIPGHYIGEGIGLTSTELYLLHGERYWKGASRVLDAERHLAEPTCGWCVIQGNKTDLVHPQSGLRIDLDLAWPDYRGRSITVVSAG